MSPFSNHRYKEQCLFAIDGGPQDDGGGRYFQYSEKDYRRLHVERNSTKSQMKTIS